MEMVQYIHAKYILYFTCYGSLIYLVSFIYELNK